MPPSTSGRMPPGGAGQMAVQSGGDPGIDWTVPKRWTNAAGSSMRVATYNIPGPSDAPEAQCAVFYFGPGQGGGTNANIDRWIDEFSDPKTPERTSKTVNGMPVSLVRVKGTYVAHAGMGGDAGTHPDHELFGAIIEGPSGAVFFKLTGPARRSTRPPRSSTRCSARSRRGVAAAAAVARSARTTIRVTSSA